MVDDGIGQKPQRHARAGQPQAVIDILAVHKQRFIEIANLFNDRARQQHAAKGDKAYLLFLRKARAVLFMAAQMLHPAGLGVQRAARKPDLVRRVHKQHLRAADRPGRGFGQQLFEKIRARGRVIVEQQRKITAIGQCAADPDVVGRRKADILLLGQKHRVRRQFVLQLRHRIIGRGVIDQDDLKIGKGLPLQAFQTDQRVLPAVVIGDDDSDLRHGLPLILVHGVNDCLHLRLGHAVIHRQAQLGGGDLLCQRQCALRKAQLCRWIGVG